MTSVDLEPHTAPVAPHARRSTGRTAGIPAVFWPIGAMIVLLPVLVVLIAMLVF